MDKIYTEVNEILNLLGTSYIERLPKDLYSLILDSKDENYKANFSSIEDISTNNCSKEAIDMIALFHANYWCNNEEEKQTLNQTLNNNYIKNEKNKAEKYNYNNIFNQEENRNTENTNTLKTEDLVISPKESFFKKIINKLKHFLHIK